MKSGRGGMGSHKHGVSGRVPHNKSNAMARSREVNREKEIVESIKKKRRPKMWDSVMEVFKAR